MPVQAKVVSERVEGEHVVSVVNVLDAGAARTVTVRSGRPGTLDDLDQIQEVRDAVADRAQDGGVQALYAEVDAARRGAIATTAEEALAALEASSSSADTLQVRALPSATTTDLDAALEIFLANRGALGIKVSGAVAAELRKLGAKPAAAR